jgi:plastocyanin
MRFGGVGFGRRSPRTVATLVVLSSTVAGITAASAASGFRDEGVLRGVNAAQHTLMVQGTDGDPALRGRTVTIHLVSSSRVERDGARSSIRSLRPGDGVVVQGKRDPRGGLVASTVDATSPPRPDAPAAAVPANCVSYYPCTPGFPPATASGTLTITISNYVFDPPVNVVPAGTLVTVRNTDGASHTFSGDHLDSGSLAKGGSFTVEFTTPGTYRFFCAIHPFMNGVLDVVP